MNFMNYSKTVVVLYFFSSLGYATMLSPDIIQNNQEKTLQREKQRKETDRLLTQPIDYEANHAIESPPVPSSYSSVNTGVVYVRGICLDFGNRKKLFNPDELVKEYLNKNLNNVDIYNVIRTLSANLYEKGYVTSSITINDKKNITNGILYLKVDWGRVKKIKINGSNDVSFLKRMEAKLALPDRDDDILNMRDIDQAIENSNNGFKKTKINILPGDDYGYSDLDYITEQRYYPRLSLRADNGGQSNKDGPYRYTGNVSIGNLLSLNDMLMIGGNYRHFHNNNDFIDHGYFINYSAKWGYNSLSLFLSKSETETPNLIAGVNFPYENRVKMYSGTFRHKFYTSKVSQASASFELKTKESNNYLNGSKLDVNSNNYTDFTLGLQGVYQYPSVSFVGDLSWNRGLSLNNGQEASYNNTGTDGHMNRFMGSLSTYVPFSVGSQSLFYRNQLNIQYSPTALINNYQISLSDEYTIRGLNSNSSLSGDSGFYIMNTIGLPIRIPVNGGGLDMSPFIGLDTGGVKSNLTKNRKNVSSVSAGVSSSLNNFDVSLIWGKVFHVSDGSNPNSVFYLNGGFSF